ncbi:MAG TPA: phosphoadenylyl-sulfate reductase [Elusimicrobiota bacterium]|jgi:phosphoadenylyl-sulfate reductase (thioredoxin)|nr:phosphoadenylyl-sulfate reductase [Elusimicrobiota bacterium]HNA59801.1 phosphoadenylyl-sulfate reductase [Elusimicrobiota bacterium]
MTTIAPALLEELKDLADPVALLRDLHRRFGNRLAVGTSGQLSGSAIVALCVEAGFTPRVFTNDTGRLFPETHDLFRRLEERYRLTVERFAPDPKILGEMVSTYGEYLFFDSKERQELCCEVRKVLPNDRALATLDVWVTGLRADQSRSRAKTPRLQILNLKEPTGQRPVLKVAPLVDWTEERVRAYLRENNVPVHALLEKTLPGGYYYESLGCVLCTTPIGPNESRRAGRWRWFNTSDDKKECGLHLPPHDPTSPDVP